LDSAIAQIEKSLAEGDVVKASSLMTAVYDRWEGLDTQSRQAIKAIEPVYISILDRHRTVRDD
jgi:hypothetical protein